MKILHTADWHLGKKLNGFSRHEEQVLVLQEICEEAEKHLVDLVLIAGDLFDGPNPSSESTELFYKTLRRLSADGSRAVVAIAGNHDSPDRIAAPEPLALACGIVLVGYPDAEVPSFETDKGVKVLQTEPGFLELALPECPYPIRLILTPFANETRLRTFFGDEEGASGLEESLSNRWKHLAERHCDPKGVNLLMTHLYFVPETGPVEEETEGERSIAGLGGTEALRASILPPQMHYAALGHIHKFWKVTSQPFPVVYSSSPLAYSLNEAGQEKYIVLLDAEPGKAVSMVKQPLKSGKPVLRKTFESVDEAVFWLQEHPEVWVELTIVSDEYLNSEDTRRLHQAHSGIVDVVPQSRKTASGEEQEAPGVDLDLDKMTLFESFFRQRKGIDPDEELRKLFHEILHS